ncbi:hypothetical protein EW146_g4750 [Bondarzewia mesenterica]|uniref:Uncharacterized protein n=1 Tax=Bondarzewia mesenterica TaxID=1095465 RepID=A0A4S4LVQ2_9AGAM|nr:hypothetical protein EW146_g4750 [Bondarzewia mesenterica]
MDPPPSTTTARRFTIRVGFGRKRQRKPSTRRTPSVSQRSPGTSTTRAAQHTTKPSAGAGSSTDIPVSINPSAMHFNDGAAKLSMPFVLIGRRAILSRPSSSPSPATRPLQRGSRDSPFRTADDMVLVPQRSTRSIASDALKPQKSRGFFGRLTLKFRPRLPSPGATAQTSTPTSPSPLRRVSQDSITCRGASAKRRGTRAAGPPLPNTFSSRSRREEALRERGLLPPAQIKYLSDLEAEEDRRLGVMRESRPFESDDGLSRAKEVVVMWRAGNSAASLIENKDANERASVEQERSSSTSEGRRTFEGGSKYKEMISSPLSSSFPSTDDHSLPNSPMSFGQAFTAIPDADSSPPPVPPKSLHRHPMGPRPSPPSTPRASISRSRNSIDDTASKRSPTAHTVTRTPTSGTDTSDKVAQWLRTSTPSSTPPRTTTSSPRTTASSPRTAMPADIRRRESGESSRRPISPASPTSQFAAQQALPRSRPSSSRSTTLSSPPTSPKVPLSPGRSPSTTSPRIRPSNLPPPTGPLPPLPSPKTSSPTGLHPSNSTHTQSTTTAPSSPTIPSLIDSVSSHVSQSTSGSIASMPVTPSFPSVPITYDQTRDAAGKGSKAGRPQGPSIIVESSEEPAGAEIVIETPPSSEELGILPSAQQAFHRPTPRTLPLAAADRPKSMGASLFTRRKDRSPTLGVEPQMAKPLSLLNLRQTFSGALRPRPLSSAPSSMPVLRVHSGLEAVPRAALSPQMHSRGSILLQTRGIEDAESRRLSEMAFLD